MTETPVQTRLHPGQFLLAARRRARLSGRALASKAAVTSSYISKVESGDVEPSLRHFARLAVALGLNPYEVWVVVCSAAAESSCQTGCGESEG